MQVKLIVICFGLEKYFLTKKILSIGYVLVLQKVCAKSLIFHYSRSKLTVLIGNASKWLFNASRELQIKYRSLHLEQSLLSRENLIQRLKIEYFKYRTRIQINSHIEFLISNNFSMSCHKQEKVILEVFCSMCNFLEMLPYLGMC